MREKIKKYRMQIFLAAVLMVHCAYIFLSGAQCRFLKYFHIICPGCGMTRAVRALFCLDFKAAFFYHPMVFSLPLVFIYIFTNGRLFHKKIVDNIVLGCIGAGFVINYVIKLFFFLR